MQGLPHVQGSTAATSKAEKKKEKFQMEKESWVSKKKKNHITSHLMDDAVILIEKLNAVGWRPMLFLEYPNKKVKTLLPEGLKLSSGEKICLNNMNTIYSMIVQGKTVPTDPSATGNLQRDPEEETIVVLNLETIQDPPPQQVEAPLPTSPATDTNEGEKNYKRRQRTKVSKKEMDCPHNSQEVHAYRCVLKTRKRKGKMEKLIDWLPCKLCGKSWPPTWEAA
ncbi:uncharacterized protein LOC143718509 [Siphateles boraxobius]|uniref:uncharacterized protein LOC143718509 n=1 Tax=Siphateles boraxobius TaxID=180520 RepID=UPI004063AAA0